MAMTTSQNGEAPSTAQYASLLGSWPTRLGQRSMLLGTAEESEESKARDMAMEKVKQREEELLQHEKDVTRRLEELDLLWKQRQAPLIEKLESIRNELKQCEREMVLIETPELREEDDGPPPGPECLNWVDSTWFTTACNVVVLLNLATMGARMRFPQWSIFLSLLDQAFLVWYLFELTCKAIYHQRKLFVGRITSVWWNWMDTGIVAGGIIDQWMLPILSMIGLVGPGGFFNGSFLRALRLLRLFRLMRALKLVKALFLADLAWVSGPAFEAFISIVIMANSVVMSWELDFPCASWVYVEHGFLVIYVFELVLKFKRWGFEFFWEKDNMWWNHLDFVIVSGGVVDLWLLPLLNMLQTELTSKPSTIGSEQLGNFVTMLRLMRLLRVLRLVRLLRSIKPLYRLCVGVIEALSAMKWVMVLTMLVLYAGAIFFTTLVGKGVLYGGHPPSEEAKEVFSSVPQSLFSLFKLMNGDTNVVDPITSTASGRLLFAGFMVLANWAILAILTSVVSDNMIAASAKTIQEDEDRAKHEQEEGIRRRLMAVFREMDPKDTGEITEVQFRCLLDDPIYCKMLCEASGLSAMVLSDLFHWMASLNEGVQVGGEEATLPEGVGRRRAAGNVNYQQFVDCLRDESRPADRRSQLRIAQQLKSLEDLIEARFHQLRGEKDWGIVGGHNRRASTPLMPKGGDMV